jgi:putative transposase
VHTTANVLNKAPKSVQPGKKADLREIESAADRAAAEQAIAVFAGNYALNTPRRSIA